MKKTILINLSGMAFRIEEDAYEQLRNYLESIALRLGDESGTSETITDIESRIAELLSAVVHSTDGVVTLSDVEEVIKTVGKPADFGWQFAEQEPKKIDNWRSRRLYRDPNNRIFGGVCSGLGTYFNIDPVIFRIFFILGFFLGILFIAYLLLWIIIPKANTIEQHAQMKAGYNNFSDKRKNTFPSNEKRQYDNKILKSLKTIVGVIILFFTTITLFSLTIGFFVLHFSLFNINSNAHNKIFSSEVATLLLDSTSALCGFIGIGMIILIPIFLILYLGLYLIFDFKKGGKLIGISGFILWLIGILMVVFAAFNTAAQFKERATVSQIVILQPFECDTLFIKWNSPEKCNKTIFTINKLRLSVSDTKIENENRTMVYKNNKILIDGKPKIEYIYGADKFAMTVVRESNGFTIEQAEYFASKIEYNWKQEKNELFLDRQFTIPDGNPVRGQRLTLKIEIPDGKEIW
ncbi:MAG: PspC domain-containing protein [Marinilabiliaceae bacterium]|nr:PspC domain-containing protein [Marinilabiliaceae bacterium]